VARLFTAMDVLVLPTIGTTFTVPEVLADPVATNTTLGYYTHFGNLLDLCAIAVPAGFTANDRGYDVLVLSDCVGSYFPEFQRVGLEMVAAQGGIFGWVTDSTTLLAHLPNPHRGSGCGRTGRDRRSAVKACRDGASPAAGPTGVFPALGIALIVGNVYYTILARRLARREQRTDVTAMPYGPSVPHMFIVVFVIMLPIYLKTNDPIRAWTAGLAWAFIIGVIVLIGAFIGPYIRKITPRAALLGTLAGISVSFISMRPAGQIWEAAWIGLPVLGIILVGFFTDLKLPGGIPIGLAALLVGTAIAWIGGYMSVPDVVKSASDIALAVPDLNLGQLITGLGGMAPLLATTVPLGVYNFLEAMSNVESAAAAGDSYNLRSVLLADGTGAIVGSALGSPFPPAVYIGHPGWKEAGGRASYSMASGLLVVILCFLGLFGLLSTVLPMPAIVPILLYIGLLIGAQAFQSTPRLHAAAVVAAIIPNLAAWGSGLIDKRTRRCRYDCLRTR
jgi:AGZA family xanthine/uracil permease-like MFS transporter